MKKLKETNPVYLLLGNLFLSALVGAIVSFVCDNLFENKTVAKFSLSYGIIAFIIVFLLLLVLFIVFLFINNKKEIEKLNKKLGEQNNGVSGKPVNMGTTYLLMALSQKDSNPLKTELLKKAATDYNNVFAALILGGMYDSIAEQKKKCQKEKEAKKYKKEAFDLYKKVNKYDSYGVTDWLLGYAFEKNELEEKTVMTDEERKICALNYYKKSSEKGYPKAENSIGKFYHYGWATLNKDISSEISHYKAAASLGDIYAKMNCGHSQMKVYLENQDEKSLLVSEKYFKEAAEFSNTEAWLFLGILSEEKIKYYPKKAKSLINQAKDYYIKAIRQTEDKYTASAWYRLGLLFQKYTWLSDDEDILNPSGETYIDTEMICFAKAYVLFEKLSRQETISGQYAECYNNLKNSFKDMPDAKIY